MPFQFAFVIKPGPRASICLAVSLSLACCLGCGSDSRRGYIQHDEELFPVSGQVLFDGQPAKNAVVVLHRKQNAAAVATSNPQSRAADATPNPRGECNSLGEFDLYTYASDDGAPEGDYLVTVSWRDPEGLGREENYPELLPPRYLNPQSSGLTISIKPGDSMLPPIKLTR